MVKRHVYSNSEFCALAKMFSKETMLVFEPINKSLSCNDVVNKLLIALIQEVVRKGIRK